METLMNESLSKADTQGSTLDHSDGEHNSQELKNKMRIQMMQEKNAFDYAAAPS